MVVLMASFWSLQAQRRDVFDRFPSYNWSGPN
jgi:hypothetical protein